MEIIEKKTGWIYPCSPSLFTYRQYSGSPPYLLEHGGDLLEIRQGYSPVRTKKKFLEYTNNVPCECGKNCKPIKVEVEVREL